MSLGFVGFVEELSPPTSTIPTRNIVALRNAKRSGVEDIWLDITTFGVKGIKGIGKSIGKQLE